MKRSSPVFIFLFFTIISCKQKSGLFRLVSSSHSGISFNNKIVETDSLNPIDVTNIYNGGGVGIGDFNNDGLQDIYFTGNMVSNQLYLNKNDLHFDDITAVAGVSGNGRWCRGVSVIDINNDGWMDMYICASIDQNPEKRKNILYINQGLNKEGIPVFKDLAASYGLDDDSHSTMASFFDYDNDGDLDMYLVVNEILKNVNPSVFKAKITDGSFPSTGRLYQNNMDNSAKHPVFKNVTKEAGLTIEGYGHGVTIADINRDGWKDIFVTNDFISNDLLYINNHNGTFTDKAGSYFKHTSANGMGQDVIDINNDGLSDIVELDMNPEDNYRKKMMLNPGSYQIFQLNNFYNYQYQYVRNTLQVNMGPRVKGNDSIGDPVFSDLGFYSGISETDWSWTPAVADFDNDGLRDLIVTNGFPKDITDHDFIAYRKESATLPPQSAVLNQIPEVKLHNYAFRNTGNCSFKDVSFEWGFDKASFSNGAAYADLDNDGDLDMVVNNINDEASVYENQLMNSKSNPVHYLTVQLKGDVLNPNGLGAWIELYYGTNKQVYEQTPYRGYLSTIQLNPHFGLDSVSHIDSLIIKWPDGKKQSIRNIIADQKISVDKKNANETYSWYQPLLATNTLFKEVTDSVKLQYTHTQYDYIDFNTQKTLPHKLSEYGPSLAAGDINGDGLDDLITSGNSAFQTYAFLQTKNGGFTTRALINENDIATQYQQYLGTALFDADGDGDLDLYLSRGGYESKPGTDAYQDRFFINDGKGNFKIDTAAVPGNLISKSCVRSIDYDKDGDLDLLVAGRLEPWNYPKAVSCFIYRNDSQNGKIKFSDVTAEIAAPLKNIGLVCDALFSDFDNDGWTDLVLAGEWMPVTFLRNEKGVFKNITPATGIGDQVGWWTSIAPGDFDNDGDIDFVIGNLGQNSFYKASKEMPVSVYAKDFDKNESYDAFISLYLPASQDTLTKKEFPVHLRDDMVRQMVSTRAKFPNYKLYAGATMDKFLTKEQLQDALILKATNFNSSFCRNDGNGKFTLTSLPLMAQLSALNGMIADDFDEDGNLDLVINTNDFSTEVSVGRYDALNGLLLKGDGKGNFIPQSILQSGIFIEGNGKALVKFRGQGGEYLLAAGQNRGTLKVLKHKPNTNNISLQPGDISADITLRDGRKQRQEFYYGSSFLSQSARFISITKNIQSIVITDNKGKTRKLEF